jgi:outer membrane scaffolding protein for murein synthesis (MipA/OmpV family)
MTRCVPTATRRHSASVRTSGETVCSIGASLSPKPPLHHDSPIRAIPTVINSYGQYVRWVVSASSTVALAHAVFDAATAKYPDQRFKLRNGILVIREHSAD